jgi:long-chain fatty acid transport protein
MTFQNPSTLQSYKTDNPISTPIYAAVTYKVLENVSVGFSFTTPYGSHWFGIRTGKAEKLFRN